MDAARALPGWGRAQAAVGVALFLCLFAAQSGLIVLTPVLSKVADDLDVSTAAAGQLRTVSGLAAGLTAIALSTVGRDLSLRRIRMSLFCHAAMFRMGIWARAFVAADFKLPKVKYKFPQQRRPHAGVTSIHTANSKLPGLWLLTPQILILLHLLRRRFRPSFASDCKPCTTALAKACNRKTSITPSICFLSA